MKKMMITLMAILAIAVNAKAMSYEQARNQALFLTDKMAYELNLTDYQYEAAYEINLDYLMGVTTVDDLYGTYWTRRNLDLQYILLDWQYQAYLAATYFYRPLYWDAGYWHFGIYARYPHRDYFFFGRPHFYATYRGGHSWMHNGGRSWYEGRRDHYRPMHGMEGRGMRDGWDRGDYRNGMRSSSTRANNINNGGRGTTRTFGGSRSNSERMNTRQSLNNSSNMSTGRSTMNSSRSSSTNLNRQGLSTSRSSNSSGISRSTMRTTPRAGGMSTISRSSVSPSSPSMGSPRTSMSTSRGSISSSPSRGGGSQGSFGGGHSGGGSSRGGGHSFGGRR